jgi:hypothetical protein
MFFFFLGVVEEPKSAILGFWNIKKKVFFSLVVPKLNSNSSYEESVALDLDLMNQRNPGRRFLHAKVGTHTKHRYK